MGPLVAAVAPAAVGVGGVASGDGSLAGGSDVSAIGRVSVSEDEKPDEKGVPAKRGRSAEHLRATRWKPGERVPGAGRPKGMGNKITQEIREIARGLLSSEKYLNVLIRRLESGDLSPQMETLLWQYGYGKPKDTVEITITDQTKLTDAELEDRIAALFVEMKRLPPVLDSLIEPESGAVYEAVAPTGQEDDEDDGL